MKLVVICYSSEYEEESGLYNFLSCADQQEAFVHVFSDLEYGQSMIPNVLSTLSQIKLQEVEETKYWFVTDCKVYAMLVYRLLHQSFDDFFYLSKENEISTNVEESWYNFILEKEVEAEERLYQPLYSNESFVRFGNCNIKTTPINMNSYDIRSFLSENKEREKVQKYYYCKYLPYPDDDQGTRRFFLFEPMNTNAAKVIVSFLGEVMDNQGFHNTEYIYYYPAEQIATFIENLDILDEGNTKEELQYMSKELKDLILSLPEKEQDIVKRMMMDLPFLEGDTYLYRRLYLLHFCTVIFKEPYFYESFLEAVFTTNSLSYKSLYYAWGQTRRLGLTYPSLKNKKIEKYRKLIYNKVIQEAQNEYQEYLFQIPREERNSEFVIVIATNFVGDRHAPTHTTLERCYSLAKGMNKKVLLVSSNEYTPLEGLFPLSVFSYGNIYDEKGTVKNIQYKDYNFSYYQMPEAMPSKPHILKFLEVIRTYKPLLIVCIGGGSMLSDLCGRIVPTLTMGVAFSQPPITQGTISAIGRKIKDDEWDELKKEGFNQENLLESTFTFELKEQTTSFTREEFGIPSDKFVLCVIGIRLDYEVTEEFLAAMEMTFHHGTHLVFAGIYNTYYEVINKNPALKEHSTYIGYCNDILALMDVCDLYVNPIRLGGGFSIVEAFYKGVPGVTTSFGDVAVSSGPEFHVTDYEEMVSTIIRYKEDKQFYDEMVIKAQERTKVVLDGTAALKELIEKVEQSKCFW